MLLIFALRFETLKDYLRTYTNQYSTILAIWPTGWTYSESLGNQLDFIKPSVKGNNIIIYGVPYSEHSISTELRQFVQLRQHYQPNYYTQNPLQSYCFVHFLNKMKLN